MQIFSGELWLERKRFFTGLVWKPKKITHKSETFHSKLKVNPIPGGYMKLLIPGGGADLLPHPPPCIFHIYYCWDLKIGRGVKKDLNKHPWKLESDPTILKPSRGRVVTGGHGGYNLEGQCFFAITQKVGVVDCWYSVFRDPWQISCKIGENLVQFGQKQNFLFF